MNNLCCLLSPRFSCAHCSFKICGSCYDATSPGYAHSHTLSFIKGRQFLFFCPSVVQVLRTVRAGELSEAPDSLQAVDLKKQLTHLDTLIKEGQLVQT